jgi:hypothetical protein
MNHQNVLESIRKKSFGLSKFSLDKLMVDSSCQIARQSGFPGAEMFPQFHKAVLH